MEEAADRYLVKADMPGVAKDDIRVDVDGNMVTISAEVRREKKDEKEGKVLRSERYYGTMSRSFTLPVDVEFAKAEAKYADGVLRLTLPKAKGTRGPPGRGPLTRRGRRPGRGAPRRPFFCDARHSIAPGPGVASGVSYCARNGPR